VAHLQNTIDTVREMKGDDHCIRAAVEAFIHRANSES
jgi:hypothetical protein